MKKFSRQPQALNYYSYVVNNPVLFVDRRGEDAVVTFSDYNNTIMIKADIYLRGAAYSDTIARNIQSNIVSQWDKGWTYLDKVSGNQYSVTFDVSVQKYSFGDGVSKFLGGKKAANVIDIYDHSRPELYEREWTGGTFV